MDASGRNLPSRIAAVVVAALPTPKQHLRADEKSSARSFSWNALGRPVARRVGLRAATAAASRGNREEVDRLLAQVARGLEDLEFDLHTAGQQANQQKLFTSGRGQVPAQYRKAVEDYYRALARKGQR